MNLTTKTLSALAGLALVTGSAQAVIVIDLDVPSGDAWLLQTSEGPGATTFEGNVVTTSVNNADFNRGVVGQPAYGFIEYSVGGAGVGEEATATGSWTFSNLAAGVYDVATTFRARGAGNVLYTVNGANVIVDQSSQPGPTEGPSFDTNATGGRPHDYNFVTIGSGLNIAEGGSITVTIDNSNNASAISMDTVGIFYVSEGGPIIPEPASGAMALVGLGVMSMRRRRG